MNVQAPVTERQIQRAILRRLYGLLPPPSAFVFHVPNQLLAPTEILSQRDYGGALLGDGMRPGVPDLILLHRSKAYGLEVKRPGADPTPVQLAVHGRMRGAGCPVAVVRSADDTQAALAGWGLLGALGWGL